ncbi:iron-sulfur cluster-binding domain-containing protein [Rurimicrobium arvi]
MKTPGVKTFTLEPLTPDDNFHFQAGQFLTFVFDTPYGTEERRSYSISSACPLSITVKRVDNGTYSRMLHDHAQEGDLLRTIGASGFFVIQEEAVRWKQLFFFAAGVGITPIFALLPEVLQRFPELNVVLIYSNRDEPSTLFREELKSIQQIHPDRLKIEFLYSSSKNLARARLSKWLLGNLLAEYRTVAPQEAAYYLCGPFEYMRMIRITLLSGGAPEDRIRTEDFVPLKLIPKELPPDTQTHNVTIVQGATTISIPVTYPDTILSAAKKAGIPMPYSCESGRCGTCVARCIEGLVWMAYNEVLPDKEIAEGRVLTCTGYAVGGDVRILI